MTSTPIVLTGIRQYLAESWAELQKVAWPTRDTVLNLTLIVIAVSIAVGAYIALLDQVFRVGVDQVI